MWYILFPLQALIIVPTKIFSNSVLLKNDGFLEKKSFSNLEIIEFLKHQNSFRTITFVCPGLHFQKLLGQFVFLLFSPFVFSF